MSNAHRVLHILPNLGSGGAERLVVSLLKFMKTEIDVGLCVLYSRQGTILEKEVDRLSIPVWYLGKRKGPDPRMIWRVARVVKEFRPTVIHTHRYVLRYVLPSIFFVQNEGVCIHTIHNEAEHEVDLVGTYIHRIAFRRGWVEPIAISNVLATGVRDLYRIKRVPVILNGIETARFRAASDARAEVRAAFGIDSNDVVLLHVGRFAPQKDHLTLLKAFYVVSRQYKGTRLWLVGDGEGRRQVEHYVQSNALVDRVRFLGVRRDIPEIMAASDIFVLPSRWEGVPLVVAEAMAAGLPVVATAVGGVPEMITDGVTGLLVPVGAVNALAGAIDTLIRDADMRRRLGQQARTVAASSLDISNTARGYLNLYEATLQRIRQRSPR